MCLDFRSRRGIRRCCGCTCYKVRICGALFVGILASLAPVLDTGPFCAPQNGGPPGSFQILANRLETLTESKVAQLGLSLQRFALGVPR